MDPERTLRQLIKLGKVEQTWKASKSKSEEVSHLQTILYELGFADELKWEDFGADGFYGNATVAAVKGFCTKNQLSGDGQLVSLEVAKRMLYLYELLDEIRQLKEDLLNAQIALKYKKRSAEKTAIASLQTLLNDLGFGTELEWEKYRNDGIYGNGTQAAIKALALRFSVESDGEALSDELTNHILGHYHQFLGSRWDASIKPGRPLAPTPALASDENPLVTYAGSRFRGKTVTAEKDFIPFLDRINDYAEQSHVMIWVTSSFRKSTNVMGAIVTPAKRSNHLIGHAIDMNLLHGPGFASICNSTCLDDEANWPEPVRQFIELIRQDDTLRWGGDFRQKDSVHIDDNLNNSDPDAWKVKYDAIWAFLRG